MAFWRFGVLAFWRYLRTNGDSDQQGRRRCHGSGDLRCVAVLLVGCTRDRGDGGGGNGRPVSETHQMWTTKMAMREGIRQREAKAAGPLDWCCLAGPDFVARQKRRCRDGQLCRFAPVAILSLLRKSFRRCLVSGDDNVFVSVYII